MAVLVAGVGYQFMRDLSVGPEVAQRLTVGANGHAPLPAGVEVVYMHFGPIHAVHWLQERPGHFDRMIFVAAVLRGRPPGAVYVERWRHELPGPEEIQARVAEAVMGVISLDNLLIVAEHFGVLAPDVLVVEVEPEDTGWGEGFSPGVAALLPRVVETIQEGCQPSAFRLREPPAVARDR